MTTMTSSRCSTRVETPIEDPRSSLRAKHTQGRRLIQLRRPPGGTDGNATITPGLARKRRCLHRHHRRILSPPSGSAPGSAIGIGTGNPERFRLRRREGIEMAQRAAGDNDETEVGVLRAAAVAAGGAVW
jgi:hypothetical protein